MKLLVNVKGVPVEHVLVIACGNSLRSDDGIAWQAAEAIRRNLPDIAKVFCVQQLTPELAEDVALADLVIFLDASAKGEPGNIDCDAVFAESSLLHFSHHLAPTEVLDVCARLYSAKPRAFLISVHGQCFEHGDELSPVAVHAVPKVVAEVCKLMERSAEHRVDLAR